MTIHERIVRNDPDPAALSDNAGSSAARPVPVLGSRPMDGGVSDVGVRAAEHALDAALAEHRRAVRLAADARERERIARGHDVKDAAAATDAALVQPEERPMRGVRLGETWIEVD